MADNNSSKSFNNSESQTKLPDYSDETIMSTLGRSERTEVWS